METFAPRAALAGRVTSPVPVNCVWPYWPQTSSASAGSIFQFGRVLKPCVWHPTPHFGTRIQGALQLCIHSRRIAYALAMKQQLVRVSFLDSFVLARRTDLGREGRTGHSLGTLDKFSNSPLLVSFSRERDHSESRATSVAVNLFAIVVALQER